MRSQGVTSVVGQRAADVAAEIERLRDEVVGPRLRAVEGGVNKNWILTVAADTVRHGKVWRLPPVELANRLLEERPQQETKANNVRTAIRKAFFDISRSAREWYEAHPDHPLCILFTTGGRIDVFASGLPNHADARQEVAILRALSAALPAALRNVIGMPPIAPVPIQQTPNWRERMASRFGADLVESTSASDLALVGELFYSLTAHSIDVAIRAFGDQIIAVERHPTHNIAAWDGPLQWLDDAYRVHRLDKRNEIVRLVVLEDDAREELVQNREKWNDWVNHIRQRLVTDKVKIVLQSLPEWKDALSRDLLILPDTLVVEFEKENFPFSCFAHHGRAVRNITSAARAAVKCRDLDYVFGIEDPRNEKCFDQLFERLEESVRRSTRTSARR